MIARIQGVLDGIEGSSILVRLDNGLTYEVLVPAFTAQRLANSVGQPVALYTFHFIEMQGQGTTAIPRLAGFASALDRDFYGLFTTCKGIGNKRALRAMALDTGTIAAAIADRDLALLQSLPEIGRRTAETIVATLSGKVDRFVSATAGGAFAPGTAAAADGTGAPEDAVAGTMAREALEALLALGENRLQAMQWIDQILRHKNRPKTAQELLQRVYQLKAGA